MSSDKKSSNKRRIADLSREHIEYKVRLSDSLIIKCPICSIA